MDRTLILIFLVALPLIAVYLFDFTRGFDLLHEMYHYIYGSIYGNCSIEFHPNVAKTICFGLENSTGLNFLLAGIVGDIIIALVFFMIPHTSFFGGLMFGRISLVYAFGSYTPDMMQVAEMTGTAFMLSPLFKLGFLATGLVVAVLSFYIYYKFVTQEDHSF